MAFGRDEVDARTIQIVFQNCSRYSDADLAELVYEQRGLHFQPSTIRKIKTGFYDRKHLGYDLEWPKTARGFSGVGGFGGSKGGFGGSKGGSGSFSIPGLPNLQIKTSTILILLIVLYIFRNQILSLLTALTPLIGGIATVAVIIWFIKNMLSGKSFLRGRTVGGSAKKRDASSSGKGSFGGTCALILFVLIGLKVLAGGAVPAGVVCILLGLFLYKASC